MSAAALSLAVLLAPVGVSPAADKAVSQVPFQFCGDYMLGTVSLRESRALLELGFTGPVEPEAHPQIGPTEYIIQTSGSIRMVVGGQPRRLCRFQVTGLTDPKAKLAEWNRNVVRSMPWILPDKQSSGTTGVIATQAYKGAIGGRFWRIDIIDASKSASSAVEFRLYIADN